MSGKASLQGILDFINHHGERIENQICCATLLPCFAADTVLIGTTSYKPRHEPVKRPIRLADQSTRERFDIHSDEYSTLIPVLHRIGENGDITVEEVPLGPPTNLRQHEDVVLHHKDVMFDAVTEKIIRYRYPSKDQSFEDVRAGYLAT